MPLSRLLMCCLVLSLSACSSTVFVNLPEGELLSCDDRFVGTWQVQSGDNSPAEQDEPDYLTIEAGCTRFVGSDVTEHEHEDALEDTEIQFLRGKRHDYVVTRDRPEANDADAEAGDDASDGDGEDSRSENAGYTLHRVRVVRDQRIELLEINHERASDLLRAGKFHGRSAINVPKNGHRTYENVIDSEPAEVTRALNDRKIFQRTPAIVLKRVDAEVLRQALSRAKAKAAETTEATDGNQGKKDE